MYKISCNVPNCNCLYVGKSQRYIKTCVQEHIGEVTKLYNKCILPPNRNATRSTPPFAPLQGPSTRSSTMTSLVTQSLSETSYEDPTPSQLDQGLCVPINAAPTHSPIALAITRAPLMWATSVQPMHNPLLSFTSGKPHKQLQPTRNSKITAQHLLVTSLPTEKSPIWHQSRGCRVVPRQHIGQRPLALVHPEPSQNIGAKSLSNMCNWAHDHRAKPHQFPQTKKEFEPQEWNVLRM